MLSPVSLNVLTRLVENVFYHGFANSFLLDTNNEVAAILEANQARARNRVGSEFGIVIEL